MEVTRIINGIPAQSYQIEWVDANQEKLINGAFVKDWVLAPKYSGNYVLPKWNGTDYYESATQEEISEIEKPQLLLKLQDYSIDLRLRAKASAIDKKGSRDYIFAQVEMYELKYKIAKGIVSGQYFTDLLTNEALEFGLSIEDFKTLIISRYEYAEAVYQQFLFMIERCRTFIQTLIENNEFVKVATAFDMIDTLDAPEEAQVLMTSILEL